MKPRLLLPTLLMAALSPAFADDWMSRLDDGAYLTQLSIPGAHDAATGSGFSDPVFRVSLPQKLNYHKNQAVAIPKVANMSDPR